MPTPAKPVNAENTERSQCFGNHFSAVKFDGLAIERAD
jgi:hypothetical protein